MSRMPPLSTLRAFEAAARHRSFTKAADELFLTQSAISRHVRNLEEWLGISLFHRRHRAVTLTPDGEAYMRDVVDAFSRMEKATRRIQRGRAKDSLHLHSYSTFAMRWLIPRLKSFQDAHPEVDVQLTASIQPVNFDRDNIHCAVRTTPGDWGNNVRADRLFMSDLVAVASPQFVSEHRLTHPRELDNVTLLHSLARASDWRVWFNGVGTPEVDIDRGLRFESSVMTYLAAEQGMGVAIAQRFLVEESLQRGELVLVFPQAVRSERNYYFLSSPRYIGYQVLEVFRNWLLSALPSRD